jgi:hypothetical protein
MYYPTTKFEACKKIEQRLKIEELNYDARKRSTQTRQCNSKKQTNYERKLEA